MVVRSYRELIVWERAMQLVVAVYEVLARFPPCERYGLSGQLRRAAVSIPANIAEGHARAHRRAFLHFLSIARASLAEVETHLLVAERVGHIAADDARPAIVLCDEVSRMLTAMRARLADGLPERARRSPLDAQHTARKNSSQSRIP